MPLYHVRRDVPGLTQEEADAAGFRALACAVEFPGLRWIDSVWDSEGGVFFCVYEAASEHEVREHARRSRIPCDEVREVVRIRPEDLVMAPREATTS